MDLRILTEPQFGGTYEDQLAAARTAEASGFDGFFRSDHYLNRTNPSAWPGPTDAWTTLAGLARETTTIRIGTLVTAATLRHPSVLAISAAQVDRMSHGRLDFGLGSGHDEEEHRLYGVPIPAIEERFDLYNEQLEIITGLWTTPAGAQFNFNGKHYTLSGAPALRTPVQSPTPPIIIGGVGKKRTPRLAARFANEFNVIFAGAADAAAQFARVATAARAIGRDPGGIVRSAAVAPAVGRTNGDSMRRLGVIRQFLPWLRSEAEDLGQVIAGSPNHVVDQIGRYREATGITRLYLDLPDVWDLEQIELIASDVKPQLEGT
ncbi:LLM class F420-dependent oxidoreductase [Jiangella alba]|uniref:Probable F420-dependent oxidoreductase, Rv1855c family n=1 Tax=Jiangella alba TaxID=561176 RepID=A0A1H5JVU2_9ACTN|nr:LLM class F420-dependent oxidoreductase [Jiangella alba]SEE56554.1 probable F420-dependent oxidoreductase, Rv1855c family [Jiangella alba]